MSQQEADEVLALSERLLIASHKGQAENVVQLINKGAKVAVTKYGRSPLHLAAYKGYIEVVHILLKAGCNLDIQDDVHGNRCMMEWMMPSYICPSLGEQTALHRAAMVGNSDVISALIQEGCALDRQDKDGNTALHEVSWHGFSQCVKLLVKAGANIHAKNKAGNTALHLACQNGHAQSSKILLLGGSRPDSKNHGGNTCLHVAARYNHVAIIRILLGAFCSVSEKNLAGDTPLHVAAALNHKKTVRLLLELGADSHICNNAGETALDQAREHNNPSVALLLTKAPQVQSFVRGRSVMKRRDKLKAQGRAQSVPRDEMLPCKDSASAADDSQSSDHAACNHNEVTELNTTRQKNKKQKEKPFLSDPLCCRETRNSEFFDKRKGKLQGTCTHASTAPHNFKAYQLYTLYRGQDGKIMQAPLNGCRCEPLINKLENKLEATKEVMKTEIHTIQDQMNSKIGQLDRKNKHQIWALDKKTVERVFAEKRECLQRIEQRAVHERLEAERRQVSLVSELKSWCLSKLQNMEAAFPEDPGNPKLHPFPSVSEGLIDANGAGLTELPTGNEGNLCLELCNSSGRVDSSCEKPSLTEGGSASHYVVVHVESSPDGDKAHKSEVISPTDVKKLLSSVQVVRPKERSVICGDTQRKKEDLQDVDMEYGASRSRRSGLRASSLSPATERRCSSRAEAGVRDQELGKERQRHHKKHSQGRPKSRGATWGRPLEALGDPPCKPTFAKERVDSNALEVTQYFFEAVSMQMERWYERKVQEARWQADQKAQADRATLIERIAYLEDELRMLRTDREDDC